MKKIFLILLLIISISKAASFTVDDPPMFYIFNFVTYDKIAIVDPNDDKYDILEVPLVKEKTLNTKSNLILKEELSPKLLSAMVTTAISEYSQIKISGESIQKRIKHDYIMNILDSYDYSEETDYIFIGEINTLAQQFEIDLKIIDVSQQIIHNSKAFQIPFDEISNVRTEITKYVKSIMNDFLTPFTGTVCLHTDSIGIEEIQQEMIVIRSVSSKVGSNKLLNTDKDYKSFKVKNLNAKHKEYFAQYLSEFPDDNFKIITADNINPFQFLEGEYIARIYLKNNKGFYEVPFTVKPGMLNEIKYLPERKIIPKKVLPKNGILNINGIQDFTVVELLNIVDSTDSKHTCLIYNGESIYDTNSDIIVDLDIKNNTCKISNLPFGAYNIYAYSLSEEIFPGKTSVDYLQFKNTFEIDENKHAEVINIKSGNVKANKHIIVYFHPFPASPDELYYLYFPNSFIPITVSQNAGELHIHNFPDSLNDNIYVYRKGYKEDVLSLNKNNNKQYLYANLSIREEGETPLDHKRDSVNEFYHKIYEKELSTNGPELYHTEDEPVKTDEQALLDTEDGMKEQLQMTEKQVQQKDIITSDSLQKHKIESTNNSIKDFQSPFQSITTFLSVGIAQPGLMGQLIGTYIHNPVQTGFNIKIGARESLNKFFELPDYLPLTAQVALGYQRNGAKSAWSEDLNAITLNIDALYNLDEIVDIPDGDVNPFLGIKYGAHIYETWSAHLLGLQLGAMACFDLSDQVVDGLGVELVLVQTFDFDVSGNFKVRGGNVATGVTYMNLGATYAFEF